MSIIQTIALLVVVLVIVCAVVFYSLSRAKMRKTKNNCEQISVENLNNDSKICVADEQILTDKDDQTNENVNIADNSESYSCCCESKKDISECNENNVSENSSVQKPESIASRFTRMRAGLVKSGSFGKTLLNILSKDKISQTDWDEVEETLLMADLGLDATTELMDSLKEQMKIENSGDINRVKEILHSQLIKLVDFNGMDRKLNIEQNADSEEKIPSAILVVGVNGVGKTTTVGKLARLLVADDKSVVLGAADTFRAAASQQLTTWGNNIGVNVISSPRQGADPASVAFDTVNNACENNIDVAIVDTAGRLQNKKDLMDELGKIKRVMTKKANVCETLLVLDATVGQNGMKQAEIFAQVCDITGIILTKMDGTAKGGIVVSVQKALGVPVKFVGLGEGVDDLMPFDSEVFVKTLLS